VFIISIISADGAGTATDISLFASHGSVPRKEVYVRGFSLELFFGYRSDDRNRPDLGQAS
jgi:hypothetical protein